MKSVRTSICHLFWELDSLFSASFIATLIKWPNDDSLCNTSTLWLQKIFVRFWLLLLLFFAICMTVFDDIWTKDDFSLELWLWFKICGVGTWCRPRAAAGVDWCWLKRNHRNRNTGRCKLLLCMLSWLPSGFRVQLCLWISFLETQKYWGKCR